ncbi:hypothetical protein D3C86_2164360 [compost metagenome]
MHQRGKFRCRPTKLDLEIPSTQSKNALTHDPFVGSEDKSEVGRAAEVVLKEINED